MSMGSGEGRKVGKAAKAGLTVAGVGDPSWCAARHVCKVNCCVIGTDEYPAMIAVCDPRYCLSFDEGWVCDFLLVLILGTFKDVWF